MYNIGEVSEYLGLSRDTIKFYEEKGLVTPKKDEENGYRKYNMEDIHNLFLINFYREMDVEIKKLQLLKNSNKLDDIGDILKEQEENLKEEIKYKREKLKKIKNVREAYLNAQKNIDKFSIRKLEGIEVLDEIPECGLNTPHLILDKYKKVSKENKLSNKAHTLDNLLKEIIFTEEGILEEKHLVIRETKKKENNHEKRIINYEKCLYTVLKTTVINDVNHGEKVMRKYYDYFVKEVEKRGEKSIGRAYIRMIFGCFEKEEEVLYLEVYGPLK